jgi:hypothetical protein
MPEGDQKPENGKYPMLVFHHGEPVQSNSKYYQTAAVQYKDHGTGKETDVNTGNKTLYKIVTAL